ncbi:MAG: hypothetical protein JWM68_5052 [Verrucomicrobiales bacterium]|nr:hypothetical protein [Verrucomicrobiales bacterium]
MSSLELKPVASSPARSRREAFTLIEMLVVIVIIGIMATLAIPALKGLTHSNSITSAGRQLLDDIALARQKAIQNRCKVYIVFIPPSFWAPPNDAAFGLLNPSSRSNAVQLCASQFNTYALFADHNIGDQPGQGSPHYLTKWKTLPEGVIIETNMFRGFAPPSPIAEPELIAEVPPTSGRIFKVIAFTNDMMFPFPQAEVTNSPPVMFRLPYIVFDSQGRLTTGHPGPPAGGNDLCIPLAKASVFPVRNLSDPNLPVDIGPVDIIEPAYREVTATNYYLVHIDWLTGRAKIEKPKLQ